MRKEPMVYRGCLIYDHGCIYTVVKAGVKIGEALTAGESMAMADNYLLRRCGEEIAPLAGMVA